MDITEESNTQSRKFIAPQNFEDRNSTEEEPSKNDTAY